MRLVKRKDIWRTKEFPFVKQDHKIETSLEGIEHLSKEKKEKKERKMKEKNHYYLRDTKLLDF